MGHGWNFELYFTEYSHRNKYIFYYLKRRFVSEIYLCLLPVCFRHSGFTITQFLKQMNQFYSEYIRFACRVYRNTYICTYGMSSTLKYADLKILVRAPRNIRLATRIQFFSFSFVLSIYRIIVYIRDRLN